MYRVAREADLTVNPNRTVEFEGEPYAAAVSFFLVDSDPGQGPELHRHPYSETFVVRSGRARFTVGGDELEAGPGDIVVVEAGTPHRFLSLGPERLELVAIHAASRFETEWLE